MSRKIKEKLKLEEKHFPKKLKFFNFDDIDSSSKTRKMQPKKNKKLKIVEETIKEIVKESPNEIKTKSKRYNEDFIRILGQLNDIMIKQGEVFRARAYQKAQDSIIKFKEDIIDPNKQLKNIPGIGETIINKLNI